MLGFLEEPSSYGTIVWMASEMLAREMVLGAQSCAGVKLCSGFAAKEPGVPPQERRDAWQLYCFQVPSSFTALPGQAQPNPP